MYARVWDLFNLKLDLVLWDTTTTYFEGRAAEGFADCGFPKDKRPDRVQIMIGVLVSRDGFPIAHEVFPGNTAELDTSRHVVEKVKHQFRFKSRVILVADRGMVSEKLLKEIKEAGLECIVGVRMRNLRTNSSTLHPEEVAEAYKSLWQVERAFRELKLGLDLRPIYH